MTIDKKMKYIYKGKKLKYDSDIVFGNDEVVNAGVCHSFWCDLCGV